MATLREKQREQRRRAIMDAAWSLIGSKGLDDTSIEEVAAQAEVGPATVYNYFGSKTELLYALFVRFIKQEQEIGEASLGIPPARMSDGMAALFERYLDAIATRCSPILVREFYILAMSKQYDYGRHTYALKQRFLEQTLKLATHYKELGQVREDVTAAEAALMCNSAVTFPFALFALGMGVDLQTARQQLRRYIRLVVGGIGHETPSPDESHDNE